MARLKILFADDQIPDENIPDSEIRESLNEQHPEWSIGFINAFVAMRQSVKILRSAGYDVVTVSNYKDALKVVKRSHFDIAIVDLGWFADESLTPKQQEYGGWDICAAIDDIDKNSPSKRTVQIVYSNRFVEDASISMQAADSGKLPIFKNYTEATHQVLRASVKFIETLLTDSSPHEQFAIKAVNELQQMMIDSLTEPLAQQKQWLQATLIFIGLSVILVLTGAFCAIFWNFQVGTLATISSILTGIISSLLLAQLQRSQKVLVKNQEIIRQEFRQAAERFYSTTTVQASQTTHVEKK